MCPVSGQAVAGDVSGFRTRAGGRRGPGAGPTEAGGRAIGSRGRAGSESGRVPVSEFGRVPVVGVRAAFSWGARPRLSVSGSRVGVGVVPVSGSRAGFGVRARAGVGVRGGSGARPGVSPPRIHPVNPFPVHTLIRRVVFAAWCSPRGVRFPDNGTARRRWGLSGFRTRHGTGTAPARHRQRHRHGTALSVSGTALRRRYAAPVSGRGRRAPGVGSYAGLVGWWRVPLS